jgi:hypothetical protein
MQRMRRGHPGRLTGWAVREVSVRLGPGAGQEREGATQKSEVRSHRPEVKNWQVGQAGMSTYADTNTAGVGPFFYRVGVRCP